MVRIGSTSRLAAVCAALLSMCVTAAAMSAAPPAVSPDGLHLVSNTGAAVIYVKPGASLKAYDKFALLECPVSFEKGWRQQMQADYDNPVSGVQMQKIESELSAEFKKVFLAELEGGGFQLSTTAAPDVLVLRPAIVNLTVAAPENMADPGAETFATSPGQATLVLELYDSVTSQLLARVLDPAQPPNHGNIAWQTRVGSLAAADDVLKSWADTLRQYMEAARSAGG